MTRYSLQSRRCQRSHWPNHKGKCQSAQRSRLFLAEIDQIVTWDRPFTSLPFDIFTELPKFVRHYVSAIRRAGLCALDIAQDPSAWQIHVLILELIRASDSNNDGKVARPWARYILENITIQPILTFFEVVTIERRMRFKDHTKYEISAYQAPQFEVPQTGSTQRGSGIINVVVEAYVPELPDLNFEVTYQLPFTKRHYVKATKSDRWIAELFDRVNFNRMESKVAAEVDTGIEDVGVQDSMPALSTST